MPANWIEFVSTFPPRECGIATFTEDLAGAIDGRFAPGIKTKICALNENLLSTYNYPEKVNLQVHESDRESYVAAAKKINANKKIAAVCIQHEFGIFGGSYGDYLLPFMEELKKPIVTTFHSVLPGTPNVVPHRKFVVRKIAEHSKKVVCISGFGRDILMKKYGIPDEKIAIIPHGIPLIEFGGREKAKEKLDLKGKTVVLTFGLLGRRKGLEYVIRAMPELVKKFPNLVYVIVGETHPVEREKSGENYRNELKEEAMGLGLKDHILFYNRYLPLREICSYLQAADIYITPYNDPNQVSSGTLAYAVGAGKACISTSYFFAKDILRHGRGIVTRFRNEGDIERGIDKVLSNPELKKSFGEKSYAYSRNWLWPKIAESYVELFRGNMNLKP